MADVLTKEQRHKKHEKYTGNRLLKSKLYLEKLCWAKGYRYRKNYSELPGKPDICSDKI